MNSRKQILNNIRTGDRNVNEDLPILIERVSHEIRILTIGSWRSALKKLLFYKWFCPDGGLILDPFAGGSVRGIVANYLGYKYTGIELREEQCNANREQALNILEVNNQPQWYCGDSEQVLDANWQIEFDLL